MAKSNKKRNKLSRKTSSPRDQKNSGDKELYLEVSDHRRSLANLEGSSRFTRMLALALLLLALAALIALSRGDFS